MGGKQTTTEKREGAEESLHSSPKTPTSDPTYHFAKTFGNDRTRKVSWDSFSSVDIEANNLSKDLTKYDRIMESRKLPLKVGNTRKKVIQKAKSRMSVQHDSSLSTTIIRKSVIYRKKNTLHDPKARVKNNWKKIKSILTAYVRMKKLSEEILLYGTSQNLFDLRTRKLDKVKEIFDPEANKDAEILDCLMYHPECKFKKFWSIILVLLLIYTATVMPYKMAFIDSQTTTWFWIDLTIDCLFLFDIYINLNSSYYNENGDFINSRRTIFLNYLKGWLIIDFVASIPMGLIEKAIFGDDSSNQVNNEVLRLARLPRLYRLLRVARMLKMAKFMKKSIIVDRVQDFFHLNTGFVRFISFVFTVITCVHCVACFWYFFAKFDNFHPDTWVVRNELMDKDNYTKYLASIYWAFQTLLTIGFGDITPLTTSIYI